MKSEISERTGSSKRMVATGTPGLIVQEDLGLTSVFDIGPIPNFQSPELARARTRQTACAFDWLERSGITTHWHNKQVAGSGVGLVVREVLVRGEPMLSGAAGAEMIGLELLFRVRASQKFCDRVERGEVELSEKEFPEHQQLQSGVRLLRPYVEASTKWEKVDRYLNAAEASQLVALDGEALTALYIWVSDVARYLDDLYEQVGATLVDGKLEVALDLTTEQFVLIDGISLDELGVVYEGQHYGKNLLREWYKKTDADWYQALQKAQKDYPDDPKQWPPYPALDKSIAEQHVRRYVHMASMLEKVLSSKP